MRLSHHGFEAHAETRPEATAIVSHGARTSYGELERSANQLAQVLADAGCGRGDRVALFMPKCSAAVLGILGTLKAGAAYVVLDPREPPARLARMLQAAECRWVLGAGAGAERLNEALASAELERSPLIGWLDEEHAPAALFTRRDLDTFPDLPPVSMSRAEDLAQILFTSGSTGTPKGVMIEHANIVQFIRWATRYFGIDATDRVSQHPPLRFDLATFDIFGALSNGAELHLIAPELNMLPHKLVEVMRDSCLTQWLCVPSVLNLMAKHAAFDAHDFPELRRVLFAGEVLPTPTLIHWMRRLPHVSFTNLYGPTETTIASSYYTVPYCPTDERAPIPIGTACDGEELLVLDERLEPAGVDEVGDLYIRGAGVTRGYWRDEEKTRQAFLPDPAGVESTPLYKTGDKARLGRDGLFYFCGRADMQIKSRGYRIELGEIEATLHLVPELREAAVVAIGSDGFEGQLIGCAFAPDPEAAFSAVELRARLADLLPSYMLPARWLQYDMLPKNVNGKVDRAALERAFRDAEHGDGRVSRTSTDTAQAHASS